MSAVTKATVTLVKVCFTTGVSPDQPDDCQLFYGKSQLIHLQDCAANSFKAKEGDGVDSDDVVGDGDDGYGNLAKMM